MKFQDRIKDLRGTMTMEEFGQLINTKVPTISAWENSSVKPHISKLIELSAILNVSIDYLVGISDTNTIKDNNQTHTQKAKLKDMVTTNNNNTVPVAILEYNYDDADIQVHTMTTHHNVLVIKEPRNAFNETYLKPMLCMITATNNDQNIIITDPKFEITNTLANNLAMNNYNAYNIIGYVNQQKTVGTTIKLNILKHLYDMPTDQIDAFVKSLLTWTDEYWNITISAYLATQYNKLRSDISHASGTISFDELSFKTFKRYLLTNPLTHSEYQQKLNMGVTIETYTKIMAAAYDIINSISENNYTQFMDNTDNRELYDVLSKNEKSYLSIDTDKDNKIQRLYEDVLINIIYNHNVQQNKPTSWFMNINDDPNKYLDEMSMGVTSKQLFTIIAETDILIQSLKPLLTITDIVIDYTKTSQVTQKIQAIPTNDRCVITPYKQYGLTINVPEILKTLEAITYYTATELDLTNKQKETNEVTKYKNLNLTVDEINVLKKLLTKLT